MGLFSWKNKSPAAVDAELTAHAFSWALKKRREAKERAEKEKQEHMKQAEEEVHKNSFWGGSDDKEDA